MLLTNAPDLHGYAARQMYAALAADIEKAELSLIVTCAWFLGERFRTSNLPHITLQKHSAFFWLLGERSCVFYALICICLCVLKAQRSCVLLCQFLSGPVCDWKECSCWRVGSLFEQVALHNLQHESRRQHAVLSIRIVMPREHGAQASVSKQQPVHLSIVAKLAMLLADIMHQCCNRNAGQHLEQFCRSADGRRRLPFAAALPDASASVCRGVRGAAGGRRGGPAALEGEPRAGSSFQRS